MRDLSIIERLIKWEHNNAEWVRFHYNKCWVSEMFYNSANDVTFQLVKSYDTIVAFVDHENKEFIELGKWSVTTSKHVTQVYNQIFSNYTRLLIPNKSKW